MPGNTKRRKRKHRGTQTGSIDRRGRGKPRNRQEAMARARKGGGAADRRMRPPTWDGAIKRGLFFAVLLFPLSTLVFGQPVVGALVLTVIAAIFYVPLGYYTDRFFYQRRQAKEQAERQAKQQDRAKAKQG